MREASTALRPLWWPFVSAGAKAQWLRYRFTTGWSPLLLL